jgi:hypothetical protein
MSCSRPSPTDLRDRPDQIPSLPSPRRTCRHGLVEQEKQGPCTISIPISSHCFWPWDRRAAFSPARAAG